MTDVLILGAGYAGIRAAKVLGKMAPRDTTITLIDKSPIHEERTQLHEIAAGTMPANRITFHIAEVIPNQVHFLQAEVDKINVEAKTVDFKDHETLSYDYIIVALGFQSEDFGLEGAKENALPLEDVTTAEYIYQTLERNVANYAASQDHKDLTVIVAGAGFTGIELLGELVHTAAELQTKYRTPKLNIVSVERSTRLLPMLDESLADYSVNFLKSKGVEMHTGAAITKIEPDAVVYKLEGSDTEERIYGHTIIWTVGVSGSDVITKSGFEQRRNRVMVSNQLNLKDHPEVFIIGDVSAVMDPGTERPYPTTAQISTREGNVAAKNVAALISGGELEDFTYKSMGTVASLGKGDGVAQLSPTKKYSGFRAKVLKRVITDKSLFEDANFGTMMKKGRWPL
ncbi:NAD(P)/FAD-dependent oxidoreductase [Agrilactobacillus yilanensis]|uniref:NAD(P)/FAD-dependent oxidoreductase n=1 Tax=Agrilactobacillus yilanensis TaxID=2485997 RepID=A0ABW4J768_9LACO|nr:NAD(P)/FAD-dependent oxidoreductase [Agrilactobacillus yilanensis]